MKNEIKSRGEYNERKVMMTRRMTRRRMKRTRAAGRGCE